MWVAVNMAKPTGIRAVWNRHGTLPPAARSVRDPSARHRPPTPFESEDPLRKLAAGVIKFQREAFESRRELFRNLADGQSPEALFITCSDSRIDPSLLTQSEPGELFICRNAGNIVPPHTSHTGAMTASIEFAVGALGVPHIIVCGHSGCGAMKAAMKPDGLEGFPHVVEWVRNCRAAALVVEETCGHLTESERLDCLVRENVRLQMKHLETHPYVAARLASGRVQDSRVGLRHRERRGRGLGRHRPHVRADVRPPRRGCRERRGHRRRAGSGPGPSRGHGPIDGA